MIVWGGYDNISFFDTGGRYNPSTDSWTATNTTNAPEARRQHTAVWTGSEIIIWGGVGNGPFLNTGGR
jgi:N-acetylneuraminic acid mutarotase